jgi:chemotaxis protein MotB
VKVRRYVVVLFAALALGGCVTQKTYDEKLAELAACRADLKACEERAHQELKACHDLLRQAESHIGMTTEELSRCREAEERVRTNTEHLKARETELRAALQQELEQRNVEISRLRDQLLVRVLDRILFRSGSAEILREGQTVLDKLGGAIATGDERIRIEGHTDDVPIGEKLKQKYFSNWELAGARAASVVRYFEHRHAIDPTRLEAVAFSMHRPVVPNDTPENRQRNRRVEIVLTAAEAPAQAPD